MRDQARRWVLRSTPGEALAPSHFELQSFTPRDLSAAEVRVGVEYHTVAPGVRAKLMSVTHTDQIKPGDPIPGNGIGVVEASRHPGFAVGDRVSGYLGWTTNAILPGVELEKLDAELFDGIPVSAGVGPLGLSGLAAYFGLLRIGRLNRAEVVLVSSAAGAVGSVAGQIARIHGCDVVGIAGSNDKCVDLVCRFGFDAAINYRAEPDLSAAVRARRPDGIDVFFDNVGGHTLRAGFQNLRTFGRVVICGALACYDSGEDGVGLPPLQPGRRQRAEAFIVHDFADEFPAARCEIAQWIRRGQLVYQPTLVRGIEKAVQAFIGQFEAGGAARPVIKVD